MLGGVGQRMLGSVSRRMAGEFFGAVDQALAGPAPVWAAAGTGAFAPAGGAGDGTGDGAGDRAGDRAMPGVYVDAARTGSSNDFLRGIAVGAGLVLLGVVAGRLGGRQP